MDPAAENVEFKQFKVVETEAKDHHYLSSKYKDMINEQQGESRSNSFQRAINKEWKILEESLPPGIYVRAYETRTNLLRAVIIGALGTPYRHGLFFFDIFLPQNYPSTPPLVYYHAHGHPLNPNLYADGHVCLSLINTWKGRSTKEERWLENSSTLLQLLVSIQGLVLNERPYFNDDELVDSGEKIDQDTAPWIDRSNRYNERTFAYSCKTLLRIVKVPPEGFEGFVLAHFRGQAAAALLAEAPVEGGTAWFKADLDKIHGMINNALALLQDDKKEVVEDAA